MRSTKRNRYLRRLTPTTWPRWQRIALGIVSLPTLFVALTAAGFYLNLHRNAAAMSSHALPKAATPHPGQRLLVISPHCDDETLGVGGIIAEARQRGVPVTVAFLTNGDGFRVSASLTLRSVRVGPREFVRFGEYRQTEAIRALAELGVPEQDVVFLGYPDQGLKPLWDDYFRGRTYRSPFTRVRFAPYARCQTPQTPYRGEALVDDLGRLLEKVRPTDIYVTHPSDDHPDHCAAPAFVQAALTRVRAERESWAQTTAMHYFLVHRGDWPLPQGNYPNQELLPPQKMMALDTVWSRTSLSPAAQQAKRRALERYVSQVEVMGRLLRSFLRTNELVGTVPEPTLDRRSPLVRLPDASGDDLARFANPAADLVEMTVARQGDRLVVRLTPRGPVSPAVQYTIRIRSQALGDRSPDSFVTLEPRPNLATTAASLEGSLPLSDLGLSPTSTASLWVCGETRVPPQMVIDRTGYRLIHLAGSERGR